MEAEPRSADGDGLKGENLFEAQASVFPAGGIEHRRLPVAKRKDPDVGSPFLFVSFLLAKQKKSDLPPGNPRLGREGQTFKISADLSLTVSRDDGSDSQVLL